MIKKCNYLKLSEVKIRQSCWVLGAGGFVIVTDLSKNQQPRTQSQAPRT